MPQDPDTQIPGKEPVDQYPKHKRDAEAIAAKSAQPRDETMVTRTAPRWAWDVLDESLARNPHPWLYSAVMAIHEAKPRKRRRQSKK